MIIRDFATFETAKKTTTVFVGPEQVNGNCAILIEIEIGTTVRRPFR